MSDETKCRVCGRPLRDVDTDGLCSGPSPRPWGLRPTCFGQFLEWAAGVKGLEVGTDDPSGTTVVEWSRPEVQVAFDEWAATQSPMEVKS